MLRSTPSRHVSSRPAFYRALKFTSATGLQKATATPGLSALGRITAITNDMWKQEGVRSFYKGITPRILRVAPGQAVVFAVYERVSRIIEQIAPSTREDDGYAE
jgi:solute carrier family 25 (mitochondrial citrate transporter), member 1